MDFFQNQDVARKKTGTLVTLFLIALVLIIASVYLVIALLFRYAGAHPELHGARPLSLLWDPQLLAMVAVGTSALIGGGSLYKMASLTGGGHVVAELLGGRILPQGTTDPAERRLLNIVEEMAIASGVPVPPVYVLDAEPGINAFAAGNTTSDAVVAVTRGTLENLSRDELQGVIGHEFSHILNGDMRMNIRLMGVLFGILLIGLTGWVIFRSQMYGNVQVRSRDDDNKGVNPLPFLGLALFIIGYVGVFFANLIKAAISRQREFLADASAVQFTRNPEGIAGALKKIGALSEGSVIREPHAEEASHMFFGTALGGLGTLFGLLDTHPPLAERIRRIDPSFDGDFSKVRLVAPGREEAEAAAELAHPSARPLQPARRGGSPFDPRSVVAGIGTLTANQLAHATNLMDAMPRALTDLIREPLGAQAAVYALLIDRDDASVRQSQLDWLGENAPPAVMRELRLILDATSSLDTKARLPLAERAIPALRQMSAPQFRDFLRTVQALAEADHRVSLFEFALKRLLMRHLSVHFGLSKPIKIRYSSPASLAIPTSVVLTALARVGQSQEQDIARAYGVGIRALGWSGAALDAQPGPLPPLKAIDAALDDLAAAAPQLKQQILSGCAACIGADGRVTESEGELLRAIADSMGCPMPPLMAGAGAPGSISATADA